MNQYFVEGNYFAKVVKLSKFRNHSNADRLLCWNIDFNNVISDLNYSVGDLVVYFPIECQISGELLKKINAYSKSELNDNKEIKGFFDLNGRVRALKLRGEKSEGFILMVSQLEKIGIVNLQEGDAFNTVNGIDVCKKYKIDQYRSHGGVKSSKSGISSRIKEDAFQLHYDTSKITDNIHSFERGDIVVVTEKWHGTSFVLGNVEVLNPLSFFDKVKKMIGLYSPKYTHEVIVSSRNVIKDFSSKENKAIESHFDNFDVWGDILQKNKSKVYEDFCIYGEAVGYLPTGKAIQKDYDYGCKNDEYKILVYRITYKGEELSWSEIKQYCIENGLEYVKEVFIGAVSDISEMINEWKMEIEKNDHNCINQVPFEGYCIRNESTNKKAFKLKSFLFLGKETQDLDGGLVTIEDEN